MRPSPAVRLRIFLLVFICILVPLAAWLRFEAPIDERWRDWTGGAAYVIFWSALAVLVRPELSPVRVSCVVLLLTCCLEFLQLWQPFWLEAMRSTIPGRLVLGTTFDWQDFRSYFAGAILGAAILQVLSRICRINS